MKLTPAHIQTARRHLRAADPVMQIIIDAVGPYTLRFERDRFGLLVRSIVSQQISTSAACAIRKRLQHLAGSEGLTAQNLARFSTEELRSVGLSPQKAAYVGDLASKVNDGTVNLRRIGRLPDRATSQAIAAPWRPYASVASWYCWRSLDMARNTETVARGYPS